MAVDPTPGDAQNADPQDPAKAGDDFIPLDGADSDNDFGTASDSDSDTSSSAHPSTDNEASFHPHHITLRQFRHLLSCYPTTVQQVHRRKTMLKLQPKPEKGSKRRAEKKAGSASANLRGAALIQKTDFNPSETKHIAQEVEKFLELDQWRYEGLPAVVRERIEKVKEGKDGGVEGVCLSKEELVRIMEWKTKHGLPRPTLMGMIKSNQNNSVLKCTSNAISALPKEDPMLFPNEAFPKSSLDALTPLRGVGPATASLILSIVTANGDPVHQVPFYSDDLYLWLCLKDFPETESKPKTLISAVGAETAKPKKKKVSKYKRPNGELNVKYNLHEYRQLWNATWELRQRLNAAIKEEEGEETDGDGGEKKLISHNDIEKVAYVLRNIAVSGFYPDVDPEDILAAHAMQEARALEVARVEAEAKKAAGAEGGEKKKKDKKRKREEKKEKSKGGRNSKRKKV